MTVIDPVPADGLVTLTEVGVLLNLEAVTLEGLAMGPFAPVEHERLTLRSVLGIYLTAFLTNAEVMSLGHVVQIAAEAAKGARDEGTRSLIVAWAGRSPSVRWVSPADFASLDEPIRVPLLTIPVDQALADLGHYLAALRASQAMERPH